MRRALLVLWLCGCGSHEPGPEPVVDRPPALVAADDDGNVYELDPDTGAATRVIDTQTSDGDPLGRVSAMVYSADRDTWWVGTGGMAPCSGCIYRLDWRTGEATLAYDAGADPAVRARGIADLCVNPAGSSIYSTARGGLSDFYEVDPDSGTLSSRDLVDSLGKHGRGCVFASGNRMLVAADLDLVSVNSTSGSTQAHGFLSYTGTDFATTKVTIGAMAKVSNNARVFVLVKDGGGSGAAEASYLGELDPETAVVTITGDTGVLVDGLAAVPPEVAAAMGTGD